MNDFEKYKEKSLSKENFCSSLKGKKYSKKEYNHVINVWKKMK